VGRGFFLATMLGMKKTGRRFHVKFLPLCGALLILSLVFLFQTNNLQRTFTYVRSMTASVFFTDSTTTEDLRSDYEDAKNGAAPMKIIIVAGHDNDFPGAVYKDRREADMTIALAAKLSELLKQDKEFEIMLTRTSAGYNSSFWEYREREKQNILNFVKSKKQNMETLIEAGSVHEYDGVKHNKAPGEVVTTLYGVNKWANELGADIVLHIHFNDAADRRYGKSGDYSGFSVYIPEHQYSNAGASRSVAKSIFDRLSKFYSKSDLPKEDAGLVESQDLIAVGAYNTLDPVGLLIEYGYVYESEFDAEVRDKTITELAWQTYLGIHDFFGTAKSKDLPEVGSMGDLDSPVTKKTNSKSAVLDLQKALLLSNAYPPQGKTLRECPLTGNFGDCTLASLSYFQSRENITDEVGFAGRKTLKSLQVILSELGI
jgi:N-acetylmuramoyl-L-alanine amidase